MLRWPRIRSLALWSVAGCLTAVTSAWIPAALGLDGTRGTVANGTHVVERFESRWCSQYEHGMQEQWRRDPSAFPPDAERLLRESLELEYNRAAYWALQADREEIAFDGGFRGAPSVWSATLRGWPFRCLWSWHAFRTPGFGFARRGESISWTREKRIGISPSASFPVPQRIVLPLLPLWGGLSANTGIYAIAWGVLLIPVPAMRRHRRRRRGQCHVCAYDLRATPRHEPCPECSATLR